MAKSKRIAAIDWMRGFVMILMLLVFGQTAMMFYLVHRLILEGSASYGGLRHFADINTAYLICIVMLVLLYPFCLWYRGFKARHVHSIWLKYL